MKADDEIPFEHSPILSFSSFLLFLRMEIRLTAPANEIGFRCTDNLGLFPDLPSNKAKCDER